MCGFVGIAGFNGRHPDQHQIEPMLAAIEHRGPDDAGVYVRDGVALGFRRLSIQDLSAAGHQPMQLDDGELTIVFNGEVYNFVELRAELEKLGHRFRSSGDTEVILHAYREWGRDCVSRFNGMWGILIHDRRRQCLFGSRDRFGIKPLFRYRANDQWVFASEIKSIRRHADFRFEPNLEVAAKFLHEGRLDEQMETFYTGVESIPPGHCFEVDAHGEFRQWPFWELREQAASLTPSRDSAEEYAALFEDSVKLRLRSDVPLAVFLSGGMDSSSILCSIARQQSANRQSVGESLTAYGFMSAQFDESRYIADTITWTGAELKKVTETPQQLWAEAPKMLAAQDEPVHSFTPVIGYVLSKMTAADGVKVVLNGQGADETAGGYPSYFANLWQSLVMSGEWRNLWRQLDGYTGAYGGDRMRLFFGALRKAAQAQFSRLEGYRLAASRRHAERLRAASLFSEAIDNAIPAQAGEFRNPTLDNVLERSVRQAPLPIYLRAEDRNSMAHSLEFRLPFLDYRLVRFLFSLAPDEKLNAQWNKHIMRRAMQGRIPESIHQRVDKMGFPTPFSNWIRNELNAPVSAILHSPELRDTGWFDMAKVEQAFAEHCAGKRDVGTPLFRIVQAFWWLQANQAERL